eukprot:TRINITY_DN11106_c0_g2_i2.p1 TRINITY_DN11106_c0_g2~~TRINITY_DN11106_c0_g2_i2.p1  ORF type:complete len:100 (+),score=13.28 TRINITY_DN11106_c0_g2_i2:35-301(+)
MVWLFYCNVIFDPVHWRTTTKIFGKEVDTDLEAISLVTSYSNEVMFHEISHASSLNEAIPKATLTDELCGANLNWRPNIPTNKLKPFD